MSFAQQVRGLQQGMRGRRIRGCSQYKDRPRSNRCCCCAYKEMCKQLGAEGVNMLRKARSPLISSGGCG